MGHEVVTIEGRKISNRVDVQVWALELDPSQYAWSQLGSALENDESVLVKVPRCLPIQVNAMACVAKGIRLNPLSATPWVTAVCRMKNDRQSVAFLLGHSYTAIAVAAATLALTVHRHQQQEHRILFHALGSLLAEHEMLCGYMDSIPSLENSRRKIPPNVGGRGAELCSVRKEGGKVRQVPGTCLLTGHETGFANVALNECMP